MQMMRLGSFPLLMWEHHNKPILYLPFYCEKVLTKLLLPVDLNIIKAILEIRHWVKYNIL